MPKIKIDKLVYGGQGLGRLNGKTIFCWNALPGEEVEIELRRQKKNYAEAIAKLVLTASSHRIRPPEEHYLSCGPWQILSWKQENEWKRLIAAETYYKVGALKDLLGLEIAFDEQQFDYRNKIEYSFVQSEHGQLSLAFFQRDSHTLSAINNCLLAKKEINAVAQSIVDWLNKKCVQAADLKSLILRSNSQGQVIAALFVNEMNGFSSGPNLDERFIGLAIYFSHSASPASTPDKLIYTAGQNYLEEIIYDTKLRFNALSFFQVNIPIFIKALADLGRFLNKEDEVVDFYSGVGAISLPLREYFQAATLVEINRTAVDFAQQNIELNTIKNCKTACDLAENVKSLLTSNKVIIVDPPRVGLHHNFVRQILQVRPRRIIYLSCDIATQARDIKWLSARYIVRFLKIYNFFPRTPHIEGLAVLDNCYGELAEP